MRKKGKKERKKDSLDITFKILDNSRGIVFQNLLESVVV